MLKSTGIRSAEAAAITLFAVSKMEGGYVSLKRACNLLTLHGVDVSYRKSIRALLRTCGKPGFYPSPLKALEVYAKKLGLQGHVVEEAKKIIEKIKPYLGGRDPYLIALAALYIAAGGRFTYYSLSKATGRSVGRLYENVEYMKAILAKK
ncbi:MAG: hypothetical protein N3E41_02455 [Thermofilaceae archaeon]|nr:hypothetical protein [Thermofilaceae archaeon]